MLKALVEKVSTNIDNIISQPGGLLADASGEAHGTLEAGSLQAKDLEVAGGRPACLAEAAAHGQADT